jgi:biotin carboxylase
MRKGAELRGSRPDYFWVIGGGLLQVPLIEEVRSLGFRVIVSDRNEQCVCRDQSDLFLPLDIFDVDGHVAAARAMDGSGVSIAGVLAAGIDAPETMAVLAERLGLSAVKPKVTRVVNHKDQFRQAMARLGYPVPRFTLIDVMDLARLDSIASEIGYPLIIKNTDSSGSRGTRIFREPDPEGMRKTAAVAIAVSRSRSALMEECWEGPEQTVETIFDYEGAFHRCFITDRLFDRTKGYALELGLRHPSVLPSSVQEQMYSLAEKVARDLGVTTGAAKFDMMLTKDGPRIIEMTVRLSGGFDCQYLVPAATGKNVLRAAILTALGKPFPPDLLIDARHRVGMTASLWPEPNRRILAIRGIEGARNVAGFEKLFLRYNVGDVIEPYIDCTKRVCFIIVTGETEEATRRALREVEECICIETEEVTA